MTTAENIDIGTDLAATEKIKKIEVEVQLSHGENIFGVNDETLEWVAIIEVEKGGWTLSCVEFQNHDLLISILSKYSHSTFKVDIVLIT